MTADDETREILRDLAAGQRDFSRRFDGLSSRMDEFERMLSAVTLQTALTSGNVVELRAQLAALDTEAWDEAARAVSRIEGAGRWVRKRGATVLLAVLSGGVGMKVIEALIS